MSHHSSSPAMPGVNLGGWLVLERWMTPSVFAGTDATNEYELSQTVDGQARIQQHRQTFIQEADIKWLAQAGIRLLRLPIGYWALDDQPPYLSAKPQIDWLMDMARGSMIYRYYSTCTLRLVPKIPVTTAVAAIPVTFNGIVAPINKKLRKYYWISPMSTASIQPYGASNCSMNRW